MKTIITVCTLIFAVCAWTDEQAVVTFSGKGKGAIEVRDAAGKVEIVNPSTLRLNQIPADAAERERAYRDQVEAEATALATRRAEEEAAAEAAAKETADAKAAEEAAQIAAATEAELEHEEHHPRKVRRNTVRGTRYLENPPPPREAPATAEPALSVTGKKKSAAPEPASAPEQSTPEPAPAPGSSEPETF